MGTLDQRTIVALERWPQTQRSVEAIERVQRSPFHMNARVHKRLEESVRKRLSLLGDQRPATGWTLVALLELLPCDAVPVPLCTGRATQGSLIRSFEAQSA